MKLIIQLNQLAVSAMELKIQTINYIFGSSRFGNWPIIDYMRWFFKYYGIILKVK